MGFCITPSGKWKWILQAEDHLSRFDILALFISRELALLLLFFTFGLLFWTSMNPPPDNGTGFKGDVKDICIALLTAATTEFVYHRSKDL